ncbi:sugar phosphate isomerase/epimerase [Ruminococcaceae bacterium OttesenSCG-928-L11]|nr:sugar phosphate isomerase/epimerase [Ruminococcaceae bacterium OttesenSCG-928-L11]
MENTILLSGFSDEISPDFETQLVTVQSLGLKHIEIRGVNGRNISEYTPQEAKTLQAAMDAHGIRVSSVGSPCGKIKITDDFAPHFEQFKNVVALAKEFGTRNIRMFSFLIPEGDNPAAHRDEVLRRLEKMVEYAVEQDVVLLHENEKEIYGDVATRCRDLFEQLGGDHFRGVFDFANFVQCGQDTLEAYEMLAPHIAYIHIKDARLADGQVVPAGMGDGHVSQLLGRFKDSGYRGFLSLEPHLQSFVGYHALEAGAADKKEESDGTMPFTMATNALKSILWDLNWR